MHCPCVRVAQDYDRRQRPLLFFDRDCLFHQSKRLFHLFQPSSRRSFFPLFTCHGQSNLDSCARRRYCIARKSTRVSRQIASRQTHSRSQRADQGAICQLEILWQDESVMARRYVFYYYYSLYKVVANV